MVIACCNELEPPALILLKSSPDVTADEIAKYIAAEEFFVITSIYIAAANARAVLSTVLILYNRELEIFGNAVAARGIAMSPFHAVPAIVLAATIFIFKEIRHSDLDQRLVSTYITKSLNRPKELRDV